MLSPATQAKFKNHKGIFIARIFCTTTYIAHTHAAHVADPKIIISGRARVI